MVFHGQLYQPVNQFGIGYPGILPKLRIHADLRKSRDGIDFINIKLFIGREENIHSCHTLAFQHAKCLQGQILHLFYQMLRQLRRYGKRCPVLINIFGLVGIEIGPGDYLSRY